MNPRSCSAALWSVGAAVIASLGVLFQLWLPLLALIVGVPLVAFVLSEPLRALLLWLLASPVLGSYVTLSLPAGIPDVTFDRLVIDGVVLALLLQRRFSGRRLLPAGQTDKAMLLLVILGVLDVFLRSARKGSDLLIFFDETGILLLLFLAAKNLFTSDDDIKRLAFVMFFLGLMLAFQGIYQSFSHRSLTAAYDYNPETLGHLLEGRSVGPFLNADIYGVVLVFGFIWTMYLISVANSVRAKFWMAVGLGFMAVGIFLSLTRAVWVGFLISMLILQRFDRKLRRVMCLCMAGLILFSLGFWLLSPEESRLRARVTTGDTISQRLVAYKVALMMSLAKPIFGYGRGQEPFSTGRTEYLSQIGSISAELGADIGPPHNQYLYMLVQYGAVGLVLYVSIFYVMFRSSLGFFRLLKVQNKAQRQLLVSFWAVLACYLVQGVFVDIVAFPFLGALVFVFAGTVEGAHLRLRASSAAAARA